MPLKTFVKISNISNLSDARYCAGMGVDLLGFNIDPSSPDSISPENFKEITEWIAGIKLAGEFSQATYEDIKLIMLDFNLDAIEVMDIDLVEKVGLQGKPVYYKKVIKSIDDIERIKPELSYLDQLAEAVVFKCDDPTLFEELDQKLSYYAGNLRLIKGYGIMEADPEYLGKFKGIELEGSEEERPGFKDYGKVMDVLEELEED